MVGSGGRPGKPFAASARGAQPASDRVAAEEESPGERAPCVTGIGLDAPVAPARRDYAWFSLGVGSWFAAFGMQGAIFAWLLVGELDAPAYQVGIAQTSNMLPSLFLVLIGGAFADRHDPRRVLLAVHALASLPVLVLWLALARGRLSLPGLVAFGLCQGTLGAFAMPARDTLLSRVARGGMMRAVTGMTMVQFGSQSLGTLSVGAARWTGIGPVLALQALVLAVGALAAFRVQPRREARDPALRSPLREIPEGLRTVARTPQLRVPIALVLSVGVLFVGPFLVVFPVLVRDLYHGSELELSLVLSLFPLGTIVGSGLILLRDGVDRKGLAALRALAVGAGALALVGLAPPFWGLVAATFAWGLAGSVFINCSRTLYQVAAPASQRGRVLAVYQLGFMGAAPLGALAAGFLADVVGPLPTLLACAASMLAVVGLAWTLSDAPRMR